MITGLPALSQSVGQLSICQYYFVFLAMDSATLTSNGVHQKTTATNGPQVIAEGLNNSGINKPGAKLDIGIVGAGLAGLGVAIALRRKGYAVEVGGDCKFHEKREIDEHC